MSRAGLCCGGALDGGDLAGEAAVGSKSEPCELRFSAEELAAYVNSLERLTRTHADGRRETIGLRLSSVSGSEVQAAVGHGPLLTLPADGSLDSLFPARLRWAEREPVLSRGPRMLSKTGAVARCGLRSRGTRDGVAWNLADGGQWGRTQDDAEVPLVTSVPSACWLQKRATAPSCQGAGLLVAACVCDLPLHPSCP